MSHPTKVTVTALLDGDPVEPDTANQPHLDLESNFDNILDYLSDGSSVGYFEVDTVTTTGLTFGYRSGKIRTDNNSFVVAASTLSLIAATDNYIEIDSTGLVTRNIIGFTIGKVSLWKLTTDVSSITVYADKRNWADIHDEFGLDTTVNGTLNLDGADSLIGDNSGDLYIDALTTDVIFAHDSGNGQVILQDGAGVTTNQVTLNGNTGGITIGSDTVWDAGNDGTGSTLNADILDGLDIASFVRNDVDATINNLLTINKTNPSTFMIMRDTGNNISMDVQVEASQDFLFMPAISGADQTGYELRYDLSLDEWQIGTDTIWHAGNDGTGSGLDADLLDGQNFGYYEQVNVTTGDTPDYLDNKLVAGRGLSISVENPGSNEQMKFQDTPPTFITPVEIHYGTGASGTTAWATYDASSSIPAGSEYAIFETEGYQGGPDGGNATSYMKIRKQSGDFEYNAFANRASGNNDLCSTSTQCIFPITTARSFDWRFLYLSNGAGYLRLIGYW